MKKTMDRLESILKTLDENVPQILEELKGTIKGIRMLTEDINPIKDDVREVARILGKVSSLLDVLTPDPSGLKALKEGVSLFLSSIFSPFFGKKEGKQVQKKEEG